MFKVQKFVIVFGTIRKVERNLNVYSSLGSLDSFAWWKKLQLIMGIRSIKLKF